ncbi:MAG: carbamoyltransferase HypF, partial [Bacteroidales bacterium]
MAKTSSLITIRGLVQGVGFRPAVYRIASEIGIKGWVKNTNENVIIYACGDPSQIETLIGQIRTDHPSAAVIESILEEPAELSELSEAPDFRIIPSHSISKEITRVSPDISVCPDCLSDQKKQAHRKNYPLINCTNCGPRFSIIMSLPYDRPQTTMAEFDMCPECTREYKDPLNRRFHAQPVACNQCGPDYLMHYRGKKFAKIPEIISKSAGLIDKGGIAALKGTGGYHLICNAFHPQSIQKLRKLKKRDNKPFALMGKSLEIIKKYACINDHEQQLLDSWRRPVVLLKEKKKISEEINRGLDHIGVIMPYMPFHYQLFESISTDMIVFTSGNMSDEPVTISDKQALELFLPMADAVISYNREIHNRVDDSVAFSSNRKERIIRRSRGYAPSPVKVDFNCEGILGTGAELTGTFAIGKDREAILSQHIGDLKNPGTWDFYEESLKRFGELFRFSPDLIACDLHPDYLSTRFAESSGLPVIKIQHHHAHIASVLAEHRLSEKVIGISLDGTGLGDDGCIWGGEFFICDLKNYERAGHYEYRPLPGGDKAIKEPWRNALGLLYHYFGEDWDRFNIPFTEYIKKQENYKL